MNPACVPSSAERTCAGCRRRAWLLGELAGPLDRCARDHRRLLDVLALEESGLLAALGGRRRADLESRSRELDFTCEACTSTRPHPAVCVHEDGYPLRLRAARCPRMLFLSAGAERLRALCGGEVVAIVGGARASDYGAELARALGRELAASGITIATTLQRGIAASAQRGAAEVGGPTLAVTCAGLPADHLTRAPGLAAHAERGGCALAELPPGCSGRSFGVLAAHRTVAALARVVLVVESGCSARELLATSIAAGAGGAVAAVPGPITAPGSAGPNALLRGGATLVRCAEDVLELLAGIGSAAGAGAPPPSGLLAPAHLAAVRDRVAEGRDTAARLCADQRDPDAILLALTELELLGLLGRGRGGRYVPRAAAHSRPLQSSS